MKKQFALLKETISLSEAHPELDILFCTTSDFLPDEFGWVAQQMERVFIDYVYKDEDGDVWIGIDDIRESLEGKQSRDFTKEEVFKEIKPKQMIIIETKQKRWVDNG